MWSREWVWVLRVKLYFVVQLKMVGACNIPRNVCANPHSNLHNFNIKGTEASPPSQDFCGEPFVKNTTWQKWIGKGRKD